MWRGRLLSMVALVLGATVIARPARADDDGGWEATRPRHRPHITIAPELKVTTFTADAALMAGAVASVPTRRRVLLGLGGYGLLTAHTPDPSLVAPSDTSRIAFGYGGAYVGWVPYVRRPFRVIASGLAGGGGVTIMSRPIAVPTQSWRSGSGGFVFVVEPALEAELALHRNVRVAAVGSYRFASGVGREGLDWSDLSGPAAGLSLRGRF